MTSLMHERERGSGTWPVRAPVELLILPELAQAEQKCWARVVDLSHGTLPELDVSSMTTKPTPIAVLDPPRYPDHRAVRSRVRGHRRSDRSADLGPTERS